MRSDANRSRLGGIATMVACTIMLAVCPSHTEGQGRVDAGTERQVQKVFRDYASCERSRDFKRCFTLLSSRLREHWARQHNVTTERTYQSVKGGEEIQFATHRILKIERTGDRVTVTVRTTGDGEGGRFDVERHYLFVLQAGTWKIDGITEGSYEYLP